MTARIYKPSETAMQSGGAPEHWVLEFMLEKPQRPDPLMGWSGGSGDMKRQVRLTFDTKEAAIAYARKNGVAAQVTEPAPRRLTIRPQGYGGNFSSDRKTPWSH